MPKPTWPFKGHTMECHWCGVEFELTDYQRSDMRRGKDKLKFCDYVCQNQWHRTTFNAVIAQRSRHKIRAARLDETSTGYRKLYGRHEHRVVAEEMLGRPLAKGEVVHHKDGNKRNNDPKNLEVMTQSEHARLHITQRKK